MDERDRQVIKNESLFRAVNERIEDVSTGVGVRKAIEFICECGEPGCKEPITLSYEEYEAVRSDPTHFAVLPGHQHPEFERVVEEHERYAVIEKHPPAQESAERHDPRS